MRNFKNLFCFLAFVSVFAFIGCGDDEPCDGKTCASGQVLDAATCNCVSTQPCDGMTCGAGEVLDANTCNCVPTETAPCDGKTCPEGQILNASNCECVDEADMSVVIVEDNITSDVTWTSDKVWVLGSRITVESGATLTIEPGTIIKGEAGAEANATALLVARGAQIMAEGTAEAPIIFTSVADNIQPGMIASPNLPDNINGLWGGVIVLGNAPISADAESVQIEGIPPSDQNGLYGGTDPEDNSGILRYVSIRHGGTDIGEGNEINGLTLGGVGSGTVIDHIEVVSNVDDGIEWFGGTVNSTNCIVWGQGDDGFDADQAWTGTLDNFMYVAGSESDHALELDGPEGALTGAYTLKNGTLVGGNGEYGDLRDFVEVTLENIYFLGFSENSDLELDHNGVAQNYLDGKVNMTGLQFNVSHLEEGNTVIEDIIVEKFNDEQGDTEILDVFTTKPIDPSNIVTDSPTVGAAVGEFTGWTLGDARGYLDALK